MQVEKKDFGTIVHELETLIRNLGNRQPFVLPGHSYAGSMICASAKGHPEQIAGRIVDKASFADYFNIG